jgi:hypothetical protein
VTTGAITVDFESGPPVVAMSEDEAVAAILQGHRSAAYQLPAPQIAAAEGAAAVARAATACHQELTAAEAALAAGPGRLMATIVRESATSGTLSKTDAGAEMLKLEAVVARLRHDDRVLQVAAERIADYPATILRSNAAAVHAAMDAGLAELLAAARPHSAKIGALAVGSDNLRGHRADPEAFDKLEALVPRLAALEAAGAALARLGRPWEALPADDGAPAVLRLARLAAGSSSGGTISTGTR